MISPESRSFYRSLAKIVAPIALQNLISAAVNSADVLMLGNVGQTSLAAASLAGQVQFVLMLFFIGMASGLIMLTAQYWGKNDAESIETLAGIALKVSCAAGLLFALAAAFFPRVLMRAFTGEEAMVEEGARYLVFVAPSYFFLAVSQVFQAVFKSVERVRTVTALTIAALLLNIALNAVFIFGVALSPSGTPCQAAGAAEGPAVLVPAMGIRGAALATSVARAAEMAACLFVAARIRDVRLGPSILFRRSPALLRDFFRFSLPAIGNEFVWGAAFAMYSGILGRLGEDIVAANSVVGVVRNLSSVLCFGMSYGGAILLGKEMGAGDLGRAGRDASRLWRVTVLAGVAAGAVIALSYPVMSGVGKLGPEAREMLRWLLVSNGASVVGASANTVLICGIFRAGGDAKFGFVLDSIVMWCVSVPLGLLCAFVLRLPPVAVYAVLYLDEFEKLLPSVIHYRSGRWLRNITRDFGRGK